MRSLLRKCVVYPIVLLAVACGSDRPTDAAPSGGSGGAGAGSGGGASNEGAPVKQVIDADGGTVTSADGRLTLELPAGALAEPLELTIAALATTDAGVIGRIYEIGPSGTQFLRPAVVTVRYDDAALGETAAEGLWLVTRESDERWTRLDNSALLPEASVRGETSHLSDFTVVSCSQGAVDLFSSCRGASGAFTALCSGAQAAPSSMSLRWPFQDGSCVRVIKGYGPSENPLHTNVDHTSRPNDFYALDLTLVDCDTSMPVADPTSRPVVAVAAGTVLAVGEYDQGYGKRVILRHEVGSERFYSLYAHLNGISVARGDSVTAGEALGHLGRTGNADVEHLHFAMYASAGGQRDAFHCEDCGEDGCGPDGSTCGNWIVAAGTTLLPEPMGGVTCIERGQVHRVGGACGGAGEMQRPGTQGCYYLNTSQLSWDAARAACQAWGGDLAAVTSADEQAWLATWATGGWIGATSVSGSYAWSNNEAPFSQYTNWAPTQPSGGNEQCAELMANGFWNDLPCDWTLRSICEK